VKRLNRLYFLYEAYDNHWDFGQPGLHNDIFELVVDGDLSGGPLIPRFQTTKGAESARCTLFHARRACAELSHHDSGAG
jgi:hypothetical protein